jgi:hypothetical protein
MMSSTRHARNIGRKDNRTGSVSRNSLVEGLGVWGYLIIIGRIESLVDAKIVEASNCLQKWTGMF